MTTQQPTKTHKRQESDDEAIQAHAISILDEDEERELFRKRIENARKAQLIKSAYLCNNSLELVFAVVKTKIEGNSKAKDDILKA